MIEKRYPMGNETLQCFSPLLSWSRALMRVQNAEASALCEQAIFDCGWNKSPPSASPASLALLHCPTGALSVIPWEDVKIAMNKRELLLFG